MAANQLKAPSVLLGYHDLGGASASGLALNATATWLAMQFVAEQAKTLSKVRVYVAVKTGLPGTSDITCDLYSDSGGVPGSSIQSSATVSPAVASATWCEWSGFSTALTAGLPYWIVFKNLHITPASNNVNIQVIAASSTVTGGIPAGGVGNYQGVIAYGWNKKTTTNSGTAWASSVTMNNAGLRLEYSDGTLDGLPYQAGVAPGSTVSGNRATGNKEVGVAFSLPSNAKCNVKGIWFPLCKAGSPGNLYYKLYNGTTLLGSTVAIPVANVTAVSGGDGYLARFATAIEVDPATMTTLRATICDANSGSTSADWYGGQTYTVENTSASKALKPMGGILSKTTCPDGTAAPPVFTDTDTDVMPFALLLDTAGAFSAPAGGGGGLILPRSMNGGYSG